MNTIEQSNNATNERLAELVNGTGLTHAVALTLFNRGFGIRGIKESTWKGYFCKPGSTRHRGFSPELLAHAEKVFGPLQLVGKKPRE